jgi:hypothetical protein
MEHRFVEAAPDDLEYGVLYVSIPYSTVLHLCPCGCDNEVVTPITPDGWSLIFDGRTVSLYPSVGNWSYRCRSHYWIRANSVHWASHHAGARRPDFPELFPAHEDRTRGHDETTTATPAVGGHLRRLLAKLVIWIKPGHRQSP